MTDKSIRAMVPPPPKEVQRRSVIEAPLSLEAGPGGGNSFTLWMASIADTFPAWGASVQARDRQLRDFWHTESNLAGAVYTCAIANSSYEWELDGPDRTVEAVYDIMNGGKGWRHLAVKLSIDLYTQDNGAFLEIVRDGDSQNAPIIGLEYLDASRCIRTGDLETPVIYQDIKGRYHRMPWYSVITFEEFPSPVETMYGVQYCAATRVLRSAQIMRDMFIYRGEKAGGRFNEAIHVISGISKMALEDVEKRFNEQANNKGLIRYVGPLVVASLDPGTTATTATLNMKSLPESFDYDSELKWYIASLALGFGRDYQDFAPLPGRGIGTATEGEMLHLKARGKGPAAFMSMMENALNFQGVMPRTVTFRFAEQDIDEEEANARIKKTRAEGYQILVDSMIITQQVARQMMLDDGDLKPEYVKLMGEEDVTPTTPIESGEKPDETEEATEGLPPEGEIVEMARGGVGLFRPFGGSKKQSRRASRR